MMKKIGKISKNPWDSFVIWINRHNISPNEEMKLREIIQRIHEYELEPNIVQLSSKEFDEGPDPTPLTQQEEDAI